MRNVMPMNKGALSSGDIVRWNDIVLWAGLFAVLALALVFAQPLECLVAFTATDDGLYYPRLARNLAAGRGCTYDGITHTNGFHPLWLLVLRPLYACVSDPLFALRGVYGLIIGLQLGALAALGALARRWGMSAAGWIAAVVLLLLNVRSLTIWFSLLESPLALALMLLYLYAATRLGEARFSRAGAGAAGGALIGLAFLARLEYFLLAGAFGAVWLLRAWSARRGGLRSRIPAAAAAAGACLAVALPYLAWNIVNFGRLMTVSSWQKSGAVSPARSWTTMSRWIARQFIPRVQHILGLEGVPSEWLLGGMVVAALLGAAWMLTGARGRRLRAAWGRVPEFPLFVGLHTLFIVLAAPFEAAASAWYWTPQLLFLAVSAGMAIPPCTRRARVWGTAVALVLVAAQAALVPAMTRRKTMSFAKLEVAAFLRDHTPPETRGMMFDSGIVSYFSDRDFVGLNGLIGDFEQAALMRDRRYGEAATRYGVSLLVLDTPEPLLPAFAPHIRHITVVRTKFENFHEPPKPFVVYQGAPEELERIWRRRYGRPPPPATGRSAEY
jgi:hypothetical protein